MELKKALFGLIATVLLVPLTYALSTTISEGTITDLGLNQFLTNFGMLTGAITFKLGNYTWPVNEIWLVPTNTMPDQFKSNSTYLEIPANITFSTCKTSIYYNSTYGFAFKSLAAVLPNGTFCILAYNGTYDIIAKY
jgi:hypothetical protein